MFKNFRNEWNYKSADWNNTLFGTHLKQYIWDGENALEEKIPYKFIVKNKNSLVTYKLDNIKMINYLESESIINKDNNTSLIKMDEDDDDSETTDCNEYMK